LQDDLVQRCGIAERQVRDVLAVEVINGAAGIGREGIAGRIEALDGDFDRIDDLRLFAFGRQAPAWVRGQAMSG
jgi:hypothetical protein